jgi:hypothetical protein
MAALEVDVRMAGLKDTLRGQIQKIYEDTRGSAIHAREEAGEFRGQGRDRPSTPPCSFLLLFLIVGSLLPVFTYADHLHPDRQLPMYAHDRPERGPCAGGACRAGMRRRLRLATSGGDLPHIGRTYTTFGIVNARERFNTSLCVPLDLKTSLDYHVTHLEASPVHS